MDPNGEEIVNPYEAMCNDTKRVISRIQALLKSGNLTKEQRTEARSALRTQKEELRTLTWKCDMVNNALGELPEDLKDELKKLKDEFNNNVDVYIYINEGLLSKGRTGQCSEEAIMLNDRFYGFKYNRVSIELTSVDIGATINHEGGHLEIDVPKFSAKRQWNIEHNCNYPEYDGHLKNERGETIDPSGIKAEQREIEYRKRHP